MDETRAMDDWWADLEDEILASLHGNGPVAPAQVGQKLGLSEQAAASLLSLLAQEGKVRICLVDLPQADLP
jgi:predicted ArsR family transcriptional regulator